MASKRTGRFSKLTGTTQHRANGHAQKVMEGGGRNHLPQAARGKGGANRGDAGSQKPAPGMGARGRGSGTKPYGAGD